jgi:hypothetical protein
MSKIIQEEPVHERDRIMMGRSVGAGQRLVQLLPPLRPNQTYFDRSWVLPDIEVIESSGMATATPARPSP